jgi:hypothetical protein
MKGKDLRCPKCNAGAKDVAPEYDFALHDRGFSAAVQSWTMATCTNGHPFMVGAARLDGSDTVYEIEALGGA